MSGGSGSTATTERALALRDAMVADGRIHR